MVSAGLDVPVTELCDVMVIVFLFLFFLIIFYLLSCPEWDFVFTPMEKSGRDYGLCRVVRSYDTE